MAKKIKILFDSDIFNRQKYGGISWYFTEIISHLKLRENVEVILSAILSENFLLKEKKLYNRPLNYLFFSKMTPKVFIKKAPYRVNTIFTKFLLKRKNFDIFIPTYFDTDFLDFIGNKPFVLTVYDMLNEVLPHYYINDIYTVPQRLALIERATRIIAISQNTKNDIIKIYPHIDSSKIEVVYLAQSLSINEQIKVDLPQKYILFVGYRSTYKNFICLYRAAKNLLLKDPDLYIICAGGHDFTTEESELFKKDGLNRQIIYKTFEVNELFYFYQNARCFVFPSEYEGFGIPILEAMACRCPVVLPRVSSFPEVAGDAGIYFDLKEVKSLENCLLEVLENESFRFEYIEKGYEQSKKFSWEKTADQCYEIFKKIAKNEY